jgi:DNA-binding XRE family transcriptional regulator
MKEFRPAKKRAEVSVGESVRIVRELQGLSQNRLAELSGVPQATLSAIENDRVRLGVERARSSRERCVATLPSCYSPAGRCPLIPPPKGRVVLATRHRRDTTSYLSSGV